MTTFRICPDFGPRARAAGLPLVRRTGTVLSARSLVRSRKAGSPLRCLGSANFGRAYFRPVLKHGPRSLTGTQVEGPYTKPLGEMKVKVDSVNRGGIRLVLRSAHHRPVSSALFGEAEEERVR
jgi:hypothetical protein